MRIFTFKEILQKRVPTLSDFDFVARHVEAMVRKHEDLFLCAFWWGSYARKTHTRSSDLDLVVFFSAETLHPVTVVLEAMHALARERFVSLEVTAIPTELYQWEKHPSLNPCTLISMRDHAEYADAVIVGSSGFLSMERFSLPPYGSAHLQEKLMESCVDYANHKLGRYLKIAPQWKFLPLSEQMTFVSKMLSAPAHAEQKLRQALMFSASMPLFTGVTAAYVRTQETKMMYHKVLESALLVQDERAKNEYDLVLKSICTQGVNGAKEFLMVLLRHLMM